LPYPFLPREGLWRWCWRFQLYPSREPVVLYYSPHSAVFFENLGEKPFYIVEL